MSRYRFIEPQYAHYPIRLLCHVLGAPASGFYAWRADQQRVVERPKTPAGETALVKVFGVHQRCYGTCRLQMALREKGHRVGRQRQRTTMRRQGLRALQPKAFTPRTTDSAHGMRCAPNRLLGQPKPIQANWVWVSDITYLPLANGNWAYLCAFQDMAGKQVIGWRVRLRCPKNWSQPFYNALFGRNRPRPAYSSTSTAANSIAATPTPPAYTGTGPCVRMSRCGDYYDNAQADNRLKVLDAGRRASKRRCSKSTSAPFLPTWPMPRPAWPTILTTIITTDYTPVSATRRPITPINNHFKLLP